jgi:hypothetical protein
MNAKARWCGLLTLLGSAWLLSACQEDPMAGHGLLEAEAIGAPSSALSSRSFPVSGGAIHYFSTAIIHSQEPTTTGQIQRSSDIIELTGDLHGYILYHPTSVFDFQDGTLVNTGIQVFSGSVAGSEPQILHDDGFRFEVDLTTGATTGEVRLGRSNDAPHRGEWYECRLEVVGTGQTQEGDNVSDYTGICTRYGNPG